MLARFRGPLAIFGAGLLLLPEAGYTQEEESSFRSRVRAAFEQDVPTASGQDVSREFEQRRREARDPNLDTDIPEVSQRTEGPRISVKEFRFHRLQEFPEYGITREKVEQLAEELRVEFMKEDQLVASGYTVDELEQLALQLDGIGARYDSEELGSAELRRLVNMVEKQNAERGLTFGDLEEIAAELSRFYRKQGLFLAQVLIPAQEVNDGVVSLTVQEGLLGQVVAENNESYSLEQLAQPFEKYRGELVSHEVIEESLYLLNDLPSLNVTGYFDAGENPGETRLNLRVRDESSWRMVTRLDNHGSTFTGDQRVFNSVDWFNPLGIGDALTIGYLKSNNAENFSSDFGSDLGQLRYSLPLFSPRTRLEISADYNQFKLRDPENDKSFVNLLEIEGTNKSYALSVDHKFRRSRAFNLTGSFAVTDKESELESIAPLPEPGDHTYGAEIGLYVDHMASGFLPMLNTLNAKVQYGEHQNPVDPLRGQDFNIFALDATSLTFIPMPFTDTRSRLILKGRAQYSDTSLPAFEQFPLGGAGGIRAFSVRDFSADKAALLSAEWYLDFPDAINPRVFGTPLNDIFQIALIADAGYGRVNNFETDIDNDWASLAGAGMLFKFAWQESFASQVSVAWDVRSKTSTENMEEADDPAVYADFTFFF